MSTDSHPLQPLFHFTEVERECSYLPEEAASLEYIGYAGLSPQELEERIRRGWRRFGAHLFRPACLACSQCIPVRVRVEAFEASHSQRRAIRRNNDVRVDLAEPAVSANHVALYNAWHEDMTLRSGWQPQRISPLEYEMAFLQGDFPSLREMRYWRNDELVGVGLVELLPCSLSSVYFYHDPAWRPLGPGTYSLLREIGLARELGLSHVYLGYWIERCPSMSYKNRFQPQEQLAGRPSLDEEPRWIPGARIEGE